MTRFALLLTVLAACSKDNPYYCEDSSCAIEPDAMGSGSGGCDDNADCSGATSVCNLSSGVCVACTTANNTCSGVTPVCSTANTCAACVAHAECASDACLPDGSCGTDSNVAYVTATGTDTGDCPFASPCATITYAASRRSFVKLMTTLDQAVTLNNANVTILGEWGVMLQRTQSPGAVVTITGASNVTFRDVVITQAIGNTGHGISVANGESAVNLTLDKVSIVDNAGIGLSLGDGTLTMRRSIVAANDGGGAVLASVELDITNSLFVKNGTGTSTYGGVQITPGATTKVFSFNTVAQNDSVTPETRGINCAGPMTVTSTIVSGNAAFGCTFETSMFDDSVAVSGTNKNGNPQFKNTTGTMYFADDYFRIASNSNAIDYISAASNVMTDIDGDARPQNGARDIGADEYK